MSAAVNSLVKEYLDDAHPAVAKVLAKEAPLSDAQRRKAFQKQTLEALVLKHAMKRLPADDSSSDDDVPVKKTAKKASPKAVAKKAPIPDSSSDDDEPVRKPVAKKASPKSSPKVAAKKAPVVDSSDDDEPVKTVKKKPASRKASPKPAAKKAPVADSSSDDDEPVRKPAVKKASPKSSPKAVAKKAPVADSSDDDEPVKKPMPAKRTAPMDSDDDDDEPLAVKSRAAQEPARKAAKSEGEGSETVSRGPNNRNEDGTYKRFQRIDPNKVQFTHDALRDNRPGQEHLVLRQNQEMMRVKGRDFNKLKQKNKGKFYGAGVDLSVRSFQFPDSDDD